MGDGKYVYLWEKIKCLPLEMIDGGRCYIYRKRNDMKNLPERIYIRNKSPKLYSNIDKHNKPWSAYEHPLTDKYEEYISSDVSKQIAKEFAEFMVGREYILWEDGTWLGHNDDNTRFRVDIDELFDEFFNSRKK